MAASCCLWASQKLTVQQNSLRRNCMSEQLSRLLIHVTDSSPWLLRAVKVATSNYYRDYFWLPTFLDCLGIQFFNSSSFPTESVRLPLVTCPSICSTCGIYWTPCLASSHQVLSTQTLPSGAEDFSRGGNLSKHMPLFKCLA